MTASINSNLALVATLVLLNQITSIFPHTQAAAAATFKIISDQHRSRDTAASFTSAASTTQFDDDDEDGQSRDAGSTYTLVPRESRADGRLPAPRFLWPTSATGAQPAGSANASALSKLLNRDTRLRYKVQSQRTLNSSRASQEAHDWLPGADLISATGQVSPDKCQQGPAKGGREEDQDAWRRKKKKFPLDAGTKRGLLEPILLTSDVKVQSDLVLVRDQQQAAAAATVTDRHTSYDDRIDLLGSLPVKTLSQRVKVVLPYDRDEQGRGEKLFILRGGPGLGKQQVRSSPGGGGGDDDDEGEEIRPSGNSIDLELGDEANPTEELTRAADTSSLVAETRKPVRLTVKRKYGLPFSKASPTGGTSPLAQQLRSAPASTSGIRVTVGNGTRPLVVNSRGLITAAKKHATKTSRPYNPMQLFASSQTSQTLNPIETMIARRPSPGAKKRPAANLILKQPVAETVESGPVDHSDSSYTLSPITSTTNADRAHQSTSGSSSSGSHLFAAGFNRTTSGTSTTSTTHASSNFHHNPPYQQHNLEHSSTTPIFVAVTPTPVRLNNRFQSGSAGQHHHQQQRPPALIGGGQTRNRTQTGGSSHRPYEPGAVDLLSEPANTLQVHQRPSAGNNSVHSNLAHLQQTLATTSLKPTKIRIKLFNSLFGAAKPHKTISSLANQTLSASHSSGPPAPLLSSTVANNVAALLAKKLNSLVRPPSMPLGYGHHHHLPLNTLFGFRVGNAPTATTSSLGQSFSSSKLKHPFAAAAASQASSLPNLGINRRTTGVGSLLVSGLIYGLTVLPALMALTGINPLSSDSSGPLNSVAHPVASRHQPQSSEKRSKQAKARHRPGGDTALGDSTTANSDAFAYLMPLLSSPAAAAAAASIQGADAGQPLGSLSLASTVEPMRVSPGHGHLSHGGAQPSALKSLYAPPPTVLESDFSSLLEDQPTSEIEWPTTYMSPAEDTHHQHRWHQQPPPPSQYERLGQPGPTGWPMSSSASSDSQQSPARGSFVRRNRDLPNERGQWRATSEGDTGSASGRLRDSPLAATTTITTPQPPAAALSFDDRSSSFQPQQASRQVSQVASPPNHPRAAQQQSWSVGILAPNRGAHRDAHRGAAQLSVQSDRLRQQVSYLVDEQQQLLRQQQQLAQLGEGDLAILGPYQPQALSSSPTAVDFGGLRQRRTPVAKMQLPTFATSQLMNLTTNRRPWQGDSWTTLADKSRHASDKSLEISTLAQDRQPAELHQQSHKAAAPNWASESDWRAVGPPTPSLHSRAPSMSPSSSSRQDDRLLHRSQTESSPAGELGARKKTNKNKKSSKRKRLTSSRSGTGNKSQPLANSTTTTTTRAPTGKDYAESELIMAHSMAMGSRVLNEQLTGHHQ